MGDKSFVSMEQNICPICSKVFDTDSILLDKQLKDSMESKTLTGYSKCSDCQKQIDEGFVAFVEIDASKSNIRPEAETLNLGTVYRTGRVSWLHKEAAKLMFNVVIHEMQFIDIQTTKALQELANHEKP